MKYVLLVPSTYAIGGWLFSIALVLISPIPLDTINLLTITVIAYTAIVFFISISINLPFAKRCTVEGQIYFRKADYTLTFATTVLGVLGLGLFATEISSLLGGFGALRGVFSSGDFLSIRAISNNAETFGFQLSYFSWLSIFAFAIMLKNRLISPKYYIPIIFLLLLQFSLNLLFIDRTRPIWIVLVVMLGLIFDRNVKRLNIAKTLLPLALAPISIFFGFLLITGKYDVRYGFLEPVFIYVTSGIGYLNRLIESNIPFEYEPVRTFYWLSKVFEMVGIVKNVPNQILDFLYVPFPTNVGTFLEPFYSDGGLLYVIFLMPIFVIGFDRLAIWAYRSKTLTGMFFWANVVFSGLMSFFVPKLNSLPIWLFLFLHLGYLLASNNQNGPIKKQVVNGK